jgi:hypothetical protein
MHAARLEIPASLAIGTFCSAIKRFQLTIMTVVLV